MSSLDTTDPVFDNRPFWLKIGIDYDDAASTADKNSIPKSQELLNRFLRRRRKVVESRYDSIESFKDKIRGTEPSESIIFSIYAESLWMQNWSEGTEFKYVEEGVSELLDELGDNFDYEDVDNDFGIVWPSERTIRREKQDGEVIGTRPNETTPIIVKKSESGLKIRGSSDARDNAVDELKDKEEIQEIEPESTSEQVTEKVEEFLSKEHNDFKIIGIKFNGSELPERSRIQVMNERAVYNDIQELNDKHIISTAGISEIRKIFL